MSINKEALFDFCLRLGDDRLIIGHRLSEWCGHAPILEEDIALANIALDQIGQASSILTYAGEVEGKGRTDDDLAYLRLEENFRNSLLAELPNGDFAQTIVRQFFFDVYDYLLLSELVNSKDETLAAFAAKSIKETKYHLRHSSEWVVRLGDGTEESKRKIENAVNELWMYTGDLFAQTESDKDLVIAGIIPDTQLLRDKWRAMVNDIFVRATIEIPPEDTFMQSGSRKGKHTENLGYILAELQYLPRRYPNAKW